MIFRGLMAGLGVLALPVAAVAADAAVDASAVFRRSCAMCHGPDGRAATPGAKRLGVKDLSGSTLTDEQIRATVHDGVKGVKSAMPAFRGRLTEGEIDALVAHVRALRPAENAAKP